MTNPHMRNEIMNPFQLLFHRAVRNIKKKQYLSKTKFIFHKLHLTMEYYVMIVHDFCYTQGQSISIIMHTIYDLFVLNHRTIFTFFKFFIRKVIFSIYLYLYIYIYYTLWYLHMSNLIDHKRNKKKDFNWYGTFNIKLKTVRNLFFLLFLH